MTHNRPILELWASGRTDGRTRGRNFEKCVFRNPLLRAKSTKKGVGKNTHAFRLAHTESIPAAFFRTRGGAVGAIAARIDEIPERGVVDVVSDVRRFSYHRFGASRV